MNVAQLRAALEGMPDHLDVAAIDSRGGEGLVVDVCIENSGQRFVSLHCEPWVGVSLPRIEGAGDHAADKPPK